MTAANTERTPITDPGQVTGQTTSLSPATGYKQSSFVDENPNPILRLDADGRILYANTASHTLIEGWGSAIGSQAPPLWCEMAGLALAKGEQQTLEVEMGDLALAFTVVPVIKNAYVNFYGFDVTERKHVAQERIQLLSELATEKARWQATLEGMLDPVTVLDAQGRVTYINPAQAELINRITPPGSSTQDRLTSYQNYRPDGTLYGPDELPLKRAALYGEEAHGVEIVLRATGGHDLITIWNAAPLHDANGRLTGAVGVCHDVTEQRQATERLRESEARLRTSLDNLMEGFAVFSAIREASGQVMDFRYEYINEAGCRLNQRPTEEHVGHTLLELFPAHRDSHLLAAYVRVVETGEPFVSESLDYEDVYGSGQRLARAYEVRAFKLADGFAVTWRDITERKQSEIDRERLLQAEAHARHEAEDANELRLRFLGMISHELRTPLQSIKGFATTLLADDVEWDEASRREFLDIIDREADQLTDMIEQLLDLSRIESGTLRVEPKPETIADLLSEAQPHLLMAAGSHKIAFDVADGLPLVCADRQRIAQVLTNLVSNAAKYSAVNTSISITIKQINAEMGAVRFSVSDQGPGISPEDQPFVFDAFRRGTDLPSRQTKGVGLGLAICKGLVRSHGGHIWIEEREEPGTTISFTLPSA